ncbi:MAG: hypothetical protein M3419_00730 [Actinomycetota bacterium]|nr:hypothetical protein [Actinomycetota bacterium]
MSEHDSDDPGALEPAEVAALLATLDDHPIEEHVAVYTEVHRRLSDHLSSAPNAEHPAD